MNRKAIGTLCLVLSLLLPACATSTPTSTAAPPILPTPLAVEATSVPSPTPVEPLSPETGSGCITADEAGAHVGESACVEFCVASTYRSSKVAYLNSHDPYQGFFTVAIFPELWGCWPDSPESYFSDQCVRVEGPIETYNGSPEIVVSACDRITIETETHSTESSKELRTEGTACGEDLRLDTLAEEIGGDHPMLALAASECQWVMDRQIADVTGDGEEDDLFLTVLAGCGSCHVWRLWVFTSGRLSFTYAGTDIGAEGVRPHQDGSGLDTEESILTDDEPMCCPSERLVKHFRWNGLSFAEAGTEVVPTDYAATEATPIYEGSVPGCVGWSEAGDHLGEDTCVYGVVSSTHNADEAFFINFSDADPTSFYGVSFDYYWGDLTGLCLTLYGRIETYEGRPQIIIEEPDQLADCSQAGRPTTPESGQAPDPTPTPAPPPTNETQGCYRFENLLGPELTITFTRQADNWNDTFKVPGDQATVYCLDPGSYTYTIDAPPPWNSINGELVVQAGDRYSWPVYGEK